MNACDKLKGIGTILRKSNIYINYSAIGELSQVNAQVSLF